MVFFMNRVNHPLVHLITRTFYSHVNTKAFNLYYRQTNSMHILPAANGSTQLNWIEHTTKHHGIWMKNKQQTSICFPFVPLKCSFCGNCWRSRDCLFLFHIILPEDGTSYSLLIIWWLINFKLKQRVLRFFDKLRHCAILQLCSAHRSISTKTITICVLLINLKLINRLSPCQSCYFTFLCQSANPWH